MRLLILLAAWILSSPVWGQSLCYYWVDTTGAITSYTTPPLDIETSQPITSADGRLMIAMTDRCRHNQLVRAGVVAAAVEPAQPQRPPPRTPVPVPEPSFIPIPEAEVPLFPMPDAEPAIPMPEPEAFIPAPESPPPAVLPEPPAPSTPERPELRLEPPGMG